MNLADLGRRAVACKHWRWMPGMLMHDGGWGIRYLWSDDTWHHGVARDGQSWVRIPHGRLFEPDLSDPATLGCLLHLVREAWPDEWNKHVVPVWNGCDAWSIGCLSQRTDGAWLLYLANQATGGPAALASSEAEALVMALEAAP